MTRASAARKRQRQQRLQRGVSATRGNGDAEVRQYFCGEVPFDKPAVPLKTLLADFYVSGDNTPRTCDTRSAVCLFVPVFFAQRSWKTAMKVQSQIRLPELVVRLWGFLASFPDALMRLGFRE